MFLKDRTTLNDARRTQDGSLVAFVRCARTGCQDYAGYEVGKPDMAKVTVYRPENEVFSRDSMASFASAPVTLQHPSEAVTADNWKAYAVGDVGEDVVRDGQTVRVPLIVRDAKTVSAIASGTNEISMGYTCDLAWEDGIAPDGTAYQAVQRNIRINHLAIVDSARGGPSLKIGDAEMTVKKITFDGLPLDITDAGEAVINKLLGQISDSKTKLSDAEAKVATLATEVATKDAEIATLKQQVADAKVTPAQLRDAAKAFALVADQAAKLGVKISDEMGEIELRRAAVNLKLGDVAKDWTDEQVAASFGTLAAQLGDASKSAAPVNSAPISVGDARAEYEKAMADRRAHLSNAYRGEEAA
jgi:hypothetical protein